MIDYLTLAASFISVMIAFAIEKRLKKRIKSEIWCFVAALAFTVVVMLPILAIIKYFTKNA